MIGMSSSRARITATSRAWYRGVLSCLKLFSCSSSMTISPSLRVGAKTALRAPTTTWTCPAATRRQYPPRSASVRWLCSTATLPHRPRNRSIVCGVSAISGTRTIASFPCFTTSSMARR